MRGALVYAIELRDARMNLRYITVFLATQSIFYPHPSTSVKESYHSFLEMSELEKEKIDLPNSHFKVNRKVDIGRCEICPSWVFTSETEKKTHNSSFHADVLSRMRKEKTKTRKTKTNEKPGRSIGVRMIVVMQYSRRTTN